MPRDFHPELGVWGRVAPAKWQAAMSMPSPVNTELRGRVELTIGRLGAGKTTWSALRATRLARATDRQLATTGIGWPEQWLALDSPDAMESLRDAVVVWDELHLMLPSSRGLLGKEAERYLIKWLSLLRKRGICVVGTTQAWTRCATHYRQLVTAVWVANPVNRGRLHVARAFDPPEDGGKQAQPAQWFGPAAAHIPTRAEVWTGGEVTTAEWVAAYRRAADGASRPAPASAAPLQDVGVQGIASPLDAETRSWYLRDTDAIAPT